MRIPRLTHLTLPPGWHTSCDFFRIEKMVKRMRPYLSFFCFFSKLNKKLAWMFRSQIILIVVVLNKHADTFPRPKVVVYSCSKVVKKRFTPVYNPRKMAVFFSLLRQPLRPKKGRMLYPSWSFVHLQIQHLLSITNQPSYQFFCVDPLRQMQMAKWWQIPWSLSQVWKWKIPSDVFKHGFLWGFTCERR